MSEKYFRKIEDRTIIMFEQGNIRNPICILFPDDIERLMKELKKQEKEK